MSSLADSSLTLIERTALDAVVARLQDEFGEGLRSVWLFGSRARGEVTGADSDIDLIVVTDGGERDRARVARIVFESATAAGADPVTFAPHVYDPERVARRREIRSFFFQEVDRDKIVLAGDA